MSAGQRKMTLCVDFDGVIHSYTSGWKGADVVLDPPVPGAIAWLRSMLEQGFQVCVYSSRSKDPAGVQAMREWFELHGAPTSVVDALEFPTEKPAAHITIDDRAFRFEGDFPSAEWLRRFKPWNRW